MAHKRLVTRTPQTWLGTVSEALFGTAGRSVIIDGAWYRFKHGKGLVCSSADVAATRPELCIVDAGTTDDDLNHLVGTRWSVSTNCATVFAPFWRSDMSGVTPGDRSSIARSVVISKVVVIGLSAASMLGINWWMDAKFQALKDHQDSQYRSVVTHLGQIKAAFGSPKNQRPPAQ